MASPAGLARLDLAVWALIFGGCFGFVLALAFREANTTAAWVLGVTGVLAVAGGIVLLVVRSRMSTDPASGSATTDGDPR